MGKIPVRISGRGHSLVDLKYMHTLPRNIFGCQRPQHDPRSVTAADGHRKAAARGDRRASIRGDDRRTGSRDGIGLIKYFELHRHLERIRTSIFMGLSPTMELV